MPMKGGLRGLKNLYEGSPLWAKRSFARIPLRVRGGRAYRSNRALIASTERLSQEAVARLRDEATLRLLQHARRRVPFYREWFDRHSAGPKRDGVVGLLADIPPITKDMIRESPERFCADGRIRWGSYYDNTGGTTGTPLRFRKDNSMYGRELAYMFSQWERVGYVPGARKLVLRGRSFSGRPPGRRWEYNPIYNELVISSFDIDAETLGHTLKEIGRFQPEFVHGYPSAIVELTRVLNEMGERWPADTTAILCGSEPLYSYQRALMEGRFRCRVYSWYGQSEAVILAGECEQSMDYHVFPLYGIAEILDSHGNRVTEPGVEGDIVGTSLGNYSMPLIRYRTGDRGEWSRGRCECGRPYERLKCVSGRSQHYVISESGHRVPTTALIFGQHFDAFARISGIQLYQGHPGQLTIRIVPAVGFSSADEFELCSKVERAVNGSLRVNVEYRSELDRTVGGKVELLVKGLDASMRAQETAAVDV